MSGCKYSINYPRPWQHPDNKTLATPYDTDNRSKWNNPYHPTQTNPFNSTMTPPSGSEQPRAGPWLETISKALKENEKRKSKNTDKSKLNHYIRDIK
jgi:hypothetical protein